MREKGSAKGLTARIVTGTYNAIIGFNLSERERKGCLGFSIRRTDLSAGEIRWLPNMLRFPSDPAPERVTTARAPLQTFQWGDYTLKPGARYKYDIIARYGSVAEIIADGARAERELKWDGLGRGVSLTVQAEDNAKEDAAIFFNRGAAASQAYLNRFGDADPDDNPEALKWLSRGLEEALVAFMDEAKDSTYALHACIYESQKDELVGALKRAVDRGVDVRIVYHARNRSEGDDADAPKDHTHERNDAAVLKFKLKDQCVRRDENPEDAIMHNKFVILLKKDRSGSFKPKGVAGGSTNWTRGGVYGQLNVAHMSYDEKLVQTYETYFQILLKDPDSKSLKKALAALSPIPPLRADLPRGSTLILSPQSKEAMLDLYADICAHAKLLMVCAPFQLHPKIRKTFEESRPGELNYVLMDKRKAMGGEVDVIDRTPNNRFAVATILKTKLHDFQGRLLSDRESYHHAGVHVHSKFILADPFSDDPILATGSANFSTNSTRKNDENTLVLRGDTKAADIYATEFMRMFVHYEFRANREAARRKAEAAGDAFTEAAFGLKENESWSEKYYADPERSLERAAFAGG